MPAQSVRPYSFSDWGAGADQPRRSASIAIVRAVLSGIALTEERQLHGYGVRLRVVDENDVALLAESPDDARARAEADLRRGQQFEGSGTSQAGPRGDRRSMSGCQKG